jgi:hypothetical protein
MVSSNVTVVRFESVERYLRRRYERGETVGLMLAERRMPQTAAINILPRRGDRLPLETSVNVGLAPIRMPRVAPLTS